MIEIPPASFHITPYGEVDAVALERLREDFDTSQLLRLVDRLDASLADLGGIVAVRDELRISEHRDRPFRLIVTAHFANA